MSNLRVKAGHLPLASPGLIDGDARLRLGRHFFGKRGCNPSGDFLYL